MPGDTPYFAIENKQTTVEIGEQGSAQALFAVRNVTSRDLLVHMAVVVEKGPESWFFIEQADRVLFPAGADEIVVQLSIPAGAVLEQTRFALRVGADGQPNAQWVQGKWVEIRRQPIEYFRVRARAPEVVLSESGEGTIAFEVTNVTDQNLHASLEMRVEDGQTSWFDLEKQDLVLAAKETRNVDIAIHASRAAITTKTQFRLAVFKPDPPKNDWALSDWVAVRIAAPKPHFAIKNSSDTLKLDATGKGEITCTVTNESDQAQPVCLDLQVQQCQRSWFAIEPAECVLGPRMNRSVAVKVAASPSEVGANASFCLTVGVKDGIPADASRGKSVSVSMSPPQKPWWKKYWWVFLVGGLVLIGSIVALAIAGHCASNCRSRNCGGDGCGGSCGKCTSGQTCSNGRCVCAPNCSGKRCGDDDGCGGHCSRCPSGQTCSNGHCSCTPNCSGKDCGDDGCGGSCGDCAGGVPIECRNGHCEVCRPNCTNKDCGAPDGCNGKCVNGKCPSGMTCQDHGRVSGANVECLPSATGGSVRVDPSIPAAPTPVANPPRKTTR